MARTISQIQEEMIAYLQTTVIGVLLIPNVSSTAIWRNMIFVVSASILTFEKILDAFKIEIEAEIAKSRVHTRDWYRGKALGFCFGLPIISGTDQFDTSGLEEDEIEATKIVAQAAAVKLISDAGYGVLRIKVAKKQGNSLIPLSEIEFIAFKQYMNRHVCDAGTQLICTTGIGDDLKLTIDAYYDPLVIDANGGRLDGAEAEPLKLAINNFIQSLNFNGILIKSELHEHLKNVPGFKAINIKLAASKYAGFTYDNSSLSNVGLIDELRVADSGYFKLDNDVLLINYFTIDE